MKKLLLLLTILISLFATSQNARFYVPYREGNKWGFCDTLGRVKIAPKYKSVDFFIGSEITKNPAARVFINDSTFTYIDSLGKNILPIFNTGFTVDATKYYNGNIYYRFWKDKEYNKIGLYADGQLISMNMCSKFILTNNNNVVAILKNKYGMFNEKGEILIPFQFDEITVSYYQTNQNKICWYCKKGKSKIKFEQNIKTGFDYENFKANYNLSNQLTDYDDFSKMKKDIEEERKRREMINLKNPKATEVELNPKPNEIKKTFYDTLQVLKDSLKKEFKLDTIILKYKNKKFYYVEKSGKQGFIDDSLKMFLMEKKYAIKNYTYNSTISWLYKKYQSLALFSYQKNKKFGLSNEFDDTILAPIYDMVYINDIDGLVIYQKNNKYGLIFINSIYNNFKSNYDIIERGNIFNSEVNKNWSFSIFRVYKNNINITISKPNNIQSKNFLGYVGENGIEYFKN